jgi:hypothetical protein
LGRLVLLFASACASGPINRADVPYSTATSTKVSVRCVPVNGALVNVTTTGGSKVEGELLSADDGGLTLLESEAHLIDLNANQIAHADVHLYSNSLEAALLTIWAGAGLTSAATHGVFFLISGPAWVVVSFGAILPVAWDRGRLVTIKGELGKLYQYARFPAGLPDHFDPHRPQPRVSCD